jgi:arabinofuranosyltransferase
VRLLAKPAGMIASAVSGRIRAICTSPSLLPNILLVLFSYLVIASAWSQEDAYITLRTVDNFLHGFGLRWNPAERVQSYTHPLWMMALCLGVAIVRDPFIATILCSFVSVGVLLIIICRHFQTQQLALILALLIASKAFMDYTTGGLENPLSYLLLAAYCVEFFRFSDTGERKAAHFARLIVLVALLFVTRQDLAVLVGPSIFWVFFTYCRQEGLPKTLAITAVASLPAIAWCVFSLIYYGFLVPNTAFAKLGHGITRIALIKHGLAYLLNSLRLDPITLLICLISCVVCLRRGRWSDLPLALGSVAYVAYVMIIGGDFMSGRFLSSPYLISALCIVRSFDASSPVAVKVLRFSLLALLVYCVGMPHSPIRTIGMYDVSAGWWFDDWITDKRGNDSERASITLYIRHMAGAVKFPNSPWYEEGLSFRQADERVVVRDNTIGLFGYAAGPTKLIVDPLGLSDPLLSRLPMCPGQEWRPGHIRREIPSGYLETLRGGRNVLDDPDLREFYDKIVVITRERIWSAHRLKTIFQINTGKFDHLIEGYLKRSDTKRCRGDAVASLFQGQQP